LHLSYSVAASAKRFCIEGAKNRKPNRAARAGRREKPETKNGA